MKIKIYLKIYVNPRNNKEKMPDKKTEKTFL